MVNTIYRNAFKEVYVILGYLNKEECSKIPENFIKVIEKNKNNNYLFELDKDIELKDQKLLPETRAILFNIYRDYLSEEEQKNKIIEWQKKDRNKLRETKKINQRNLLKFDDKENKINEKVDEKIEKPVKYKKSCWKKFTDFIKDFFIHK